MKFEFIQKYTFPVELESAVLILTANTIYTHKAHDLLTK